MQGQGQFDGICSRQCQQIYQSCRNDFFVTQSNRNRVRPCRDEDYFCWKLEDIVAHYRWDVKSKSDSAKICQLFDIPGSEEDGNCWNGEVSAEYKGKGKKQIRYTGRVRKQKKTDFWVAHQKELIYFVIAVFLVGVALYKWAKPSRPRYYRLN